MYHGISFVERSRIQLEFSNVSTAHRVAEEEGELHHEQKGQPQLAVQLRKVSVLPMPFSIFIVVAS
jgi:hypothetical protein